MAFHLRAEFWTKPDASIPIGAPLLRRTIADAVEFDEDTEEPVALPVAGNREAYIMSVAGLSGSAVVKVGAAGDNDISRGRLVPAGGSAWFLIEPDSFVVVEEYGAA